MSLDAELNALAATQNGNGKQHKGSSQATVLVELARNNADVFLSYNDEPFASIDGMTLPLRGHGGFGVRLRSMFYQRETKAPNAQAMTDAVNTLEAIAWEQPRRSVWLRTGEHDGVVYIDLGDVAWRAIKITPDGWEVVNEPPVHFYRPSKMEALPIPQRGGSLEPLWRLINATEERTQVLTASWLIASLRPRGPYPILIPCGEHGTGKSTRVKTLRRLSDPNAVPVRRVPHDPRDLAAMARNSWVVAVDNLSGIPPWLSDCFSILSTGGGFGGRQLYTDTDEALFDYKRPQILSGINNVASRPDLQDRAILDNTKHFAANEVMTEDEHEALFQKHAPGIFGAILDGVAGSMNERNVTLDRLPRMADFARAITAAEPAMGWEPGTFMRHYEDARQEAVEANVENDSFAQAVMEEAPFEGTVTDLLQRMEVTNEARFKQKEFPNTVKSAGKALTRIMPNLRAMGYHVERGTGRDRRIVTIARDESVTSCDFKNVTQNVTDTQELTRSGDECDKSDKKYPHLSKSSPFLEQNKESTKNGGVSGGDDAKKDSRGAHSSQTSHSSHDLFNDDEPPETTFGDDEDDDLLRPKEDI